eukprot:5524281-Pleurochrysis_carterae.AAC.1
MPWALAKRLASEVRHCRRSVDGIEDAAASTAFALLRGPSTPLPLPAPSHLSVSLSLAAPHAPTPTLPLPLPPFPPSSPHPYST